MEKLELTQENYYSQDANIEYMSVSQYKDFKECELKALLKLSGEYKEPKSDAMLFGGYVDAFFSGELNNYIAENSEMFNSKTGELKAPFKNINKVIETIVRDELLMKYLSGKPQVILTGNIGGVPFKGKLDYLFDDKIVDQKIIKDLKKLWVEQNGKNVKTDFISAYGYDLQGAVYQELVKQNNFIQLPFILAITTKEEVPDKALIQIDQRYLDEALEEVEILAPRYRDIKKGLIEPVGCGNCEVCRARKQLKEVVLYSEFYKKNEEE